MYTKFEFNSEQINIETGDANWLPLSVKINGRVYLTTIPEAVAPPPPKLPLFTTDDGVDMYKGGLMFILSASTNQIRGVPVCANPYRGSNGIDFRYFSSREAAEEYILLNSKTL